MMGGMDVHPLRNRPAGTALVRIGDADWGRIVRVNRALAGLLGTTPDRLAGSRLTDHVAVADRVRVIDALADLAADPRIGYDGRWRLVAADGLEREVTIHATLVGGGAMPAALLRVAVPAFGDA